MAVTSNGSVIMEMSTVTRSDVAPTAGSPTILGSFGNNINTNGVAVDANNNLYVGFAYSSTVMKVPFVNGAYATSLRARATTLPRRRSELHRHRHR